MKIALPSRNGNIDDHFGHCEYFTVLTVDDINKDIINREIIESPAGCGCKSNIAQDLSKMGVNLMLAGNMGDGAVNVLKKSNIEVIRRCSGDVKTAALDYLNGKIKDSGNSCHTHDRGCHH